METMFVPAEAGKKRVKILLWGDTGVGKTVLALQFPAPAVIDMEGGTDHYGAKYKFARLQTATADDVMAAVDWLTTQKHDYKTLVIDPISVYWEALQKKYSDILLRHSAAKPGKGGNRYDFYDLQPKDWMSVKAEWKELIRKITELDMTVIVTARQKIKYADGAGDMMRAVGEMPDAEKTLPYTFDVEIKMEMDGQGRHVCRVRKDRTMLLPTAAFETDYQAFAKAFKELGLARKSKPVQRVSAEGAAQITHYISQLGLTPAAISAALAKYNADVVAELTVEQAEVVAIKLATKLAQNKEGV